MPEITVLGIVMREDALLLARPAGVGKWTLPGGLLADEDDTVEEAMARVWAELAGVPPAAEPLFIDTLYERGPAGVTVHNVFFVISDAHATPRAADLDLRWTPLADLLDTALPAWLREALPSLLAGEQAPEQELDLALFDLPGHGAHPPGPPWVYLMTGPAGAGKTTVSRALCARFERCAHIEVDALRHMVVAGFAPPAGLAAPEQRAEGRRQGALATLNAAALARNFVSAGFRAVIDDVLETREELDDYLAELTGLDVAVITLLPDAATLRARDQGRPEDQRMFDRAAELRHIIATNGETRGMRLDTSGLSVEETVDAVLAYRGNLTPDPLSGTERGLTACPAEANAPLAGQRDQKGSAPQ